MLDVVAWMMIAQLATWRLSSMLHTEDMFRWLRCWIGIIHDQDGYPEVYPDHLLGKIFDCFWCLSTIVAMATTVVIINTCNLHLTMFPSLWLAVSTGAIWIERQISRSRARF